MFNNVTSLVLSYVLAKYAGEGFAFPSAWWAWICAILVAAATIGILWLLYWFYLRKKASPEFEKQGDDGQKSTAMVGRLPLTNVFGIIFCVIMIVINAIG